MDYWSEKVWCKILCIITIFRKNFDVVCYHSSNTVFTMSSMRVCYLRMVCSEFSNYSTV